MDEQVKPATLSERIEKARLRIYSDCANPRIPANPTDPDIVLFDCGARIAELEAQLLSQQEKIDERQHLEEAWQEAAYRAQGLEAELLSAHNDAMHWRDRADGNAILWSAELEIVKAELVSTQQELQQQKAFNDSGAEWAFNQIKELVAEKKALEAELAVAQERIKQLEKDLKTPLFHPKGGYGQFEGT